MQDLLAQFTSGLQKAKPWDSIVTFATHKSFLGYKPFPRQLTFLKLVFLEIENMNQYDFDVIESWREKFGANESIGVQPDIWQRVNYLKANGYRRFPHIQTVLGRRASKGWTGGIIGAEHIAYMVSLDNWQEHYGIQPHKDGYLNVVATKESLAIENQFADIKQAVVDCAYLEPYRYEIKDHVMKIQTPADIRYENSLRAKRVKIERDIATIRATANASTSSSGRGHASFANFFDEFAHLIVGTTGPRSSEEVYKAYQPSLRQFGKDALTYIPSSPLTKVGQFFQLYTQGSIMLPEYYEARGVPLPISDNQDDVDQIISDPTMLILQLPSWGLYEDWRESVSIGMPYSFNGENLFALEYDNSMRILESANKSSFKVEYRGQFAEVEDAYLDAEKVDEIFQPFWDGRTLSQAKHGEMSFLYHGHADPGLTSANFAVSIGHLENAPADEFGNVWPHVIIDYMNVWNPADFEDHRIDYNKVLEDLQFLLGKYPSMDTFSFDQWNSPGFIAALKKQYGNVMRIKEVNFNVKDNFKRAEKFKSAVNLGWLHCYKDNFFKLNGGSLLEQELKFLTEKNGRIEKQDFGPVTTKDLADTVMETTVRMLENSLDRWQSALMGQTVPALGSSTIQTIDQSSRIRTLEQIRSKSNAERLSSMGERGLGRYMPSTNAARGRRR